MLLYDIGRLNVLTKNTAICARVTELSGQYIGGLAEHPPVIPSAANCSIHAAAQVYSRSSQVPLLVPVGYLNLPCLSGRN